MNKDTSNKNDKDLRKIPGIGSWHPEIELMKRYWERKTED